MKLSDYLCTNLKEDGLPYCILFMVKQAIEYIFKLLGFFILLSLLAGLTFSACPDNIILQLLPLFIGLLLFLHIGITLGAIPLFILTNNLNQPIRKILRFLILGFVLSFSIYYLLESPIFDLLMAYIKKLFPEALECKGAVWDLNF